MDFKVKLSSLTETVENASCNEDLNVSISSFFELMDAVCTPLFGKTSYANLSNIYENRVSKFEFDKSCLEKRKIFYQCLNDFRKHKSDVNRQRMVKARTEYKKHSKKVQFSSR